MESDRRALPGTIELRSTWFGQSRVRLTAHSATEWHISKVPVLVVQPVSSGIEVQLDGTSAQQIQGAGSWILVPPQTRYRIRNAGAASADAVAIQIK